MDITIVRDLHDRKALSAEAVDLPGLINEFTLHTELRQYFISATRVGQQRRLSCRSEFVHIDPQADSNLNYDRIHIYVVVKQIRYNHCVQVVILYTTVAKRVA